MKLLFKGLLGLCLTASLLTSCNKNGRYEEVQHPLAGQQSDTLVHKLNLKGYENIILEVGDQFFYADDIILSKEQFMALKRLSSIGANTVERATISQDFLKTWPDATVYYSYPSSSDLTTSEHNSF